MKQENISVKLLGKLSQIECLILFSQLKNVNQEIIDGQV